MIEYEYLFSFFLSLWRVSYQLQIVKINFMILKAS